MSAPAFLNYMHVFYIHTHTHTDIYWVGQKFHLGFSIAVYGKMQMNFLDNPIYTYTYILIIDTHISYTHTHTHIYIYITDTYQGRKI